MDEEDIYLFLKEIALTKFSTIVKDGFITRGTLGTPMGLRILFCEGSFLEVRISGRKYSYHWERRMIDNTIFRHDNAPHHKDIATYPEHFHFESDNNVKECELSPDPKIGVIEFLGFIKDRIE